MERDEAEESTISFWKVASFVTFSRRKTVPLMSHVSISTRRRGSITGRNRSGLGESGWLRLRLTLNTRYIGRERCPSRVTFAPKACHRPIRGIGTGMTFRPSTFRERERRGRGWVLSLISGIVGTDYWDDRQPAENQPRCTRTSSWIGDKKDYNSGLIGDSRAVSPILTTVTIKARWGRSTNGYTPYTDLSIIR